MMAEPREAHNHIWQQLESYFRFDCGNGNKIKYKYILSITSTWMGQLNTYNPKYCEKCKEGNRENYILDILSREYTKETFTHASGILSFQCRGAKLHDGNVFVCVSVYVCVYVCVCVCGLVGGGREWWWWSKLKAGGHLGSVSRTFFSIAFQTRFTLTSILIRWSLQNFVHNIVACAKISCDLMNTNGIAARRSFHHI